MKKIIIILIVILGFAGKNYAIERDKWETHEIILQGTFTVLTIVDLTQTYIGLYKEQRYKEKHPILGKNPSKTKFFILGASGILLHAGISHALHYLPTKINKILIPSWQIFYIGVEIKAIHSNYKIGIKINF